MIYIYIYIYISYIYIIYIYHTYITYIYIYIIYMIYIYISYIYDIYIWYMYDIYIYIIIYAIYIYIHMWLIYHDFHETHSSLFLFEGRCPELWRSSRGNGTLPPGVRAMAITGQSMGFLNMKKWHLTMTMWNLPSGNLTLLKMAHL